jgi:hypothetical protein
VSEPTNGSGDIGEYCRQVEGHLTRENEGHLVRIVGPAFELVRGWALDGIPLSLVFHGISRKAERHRAGRSKRPLRLEFCEADVREAFDSWRRAVGVWHDEPVDVTSEPAGPRKSSLTRDLDRAADRISRALGRLDLAEEVRVALSTVIQELGQIREDARHLRGAGRQSLEPRLAQLDSTIAELALAAAGDVEADRTRKQVEQELITYRARLSEEVWRKSVTVTVDRLLRDRLNLPSLIS